MGAVAEDIVLASYRGTGALPVRCNSAAVSTEQSRRGDGAVSGLDDQIAALTEPGRFFGDILDADGPEAVIVVCRGTGHHAVVDLNVEPALVLAACADARRKRLSSLAFDVAELSELFGYLGSWSVAMGSAAPSSNQGISRFVLEVTLEDRPTPDITQFQTLIGESWTVDCHWPARIRPRRTSDVVDPEISLSAWLLTLHRDDPAGRP